MGKSPLAVTLFVCLPAGAQQAAGPAAAPAPQRPPQVTESIVITGTYEPIPLDEADRSVAAFPVASGLLLTDAWTDLIAADATLDLRQRAPGGVQGDLSIRGGAFDQTLVLVNGLRVNDPQSGHHNLDVSLPMEALSQIEVLRGAGSTLYGSDAVGGAINFIPAKPETSELRLRAGAGNFGTNEERVDWTEKFGNLSEGLAVSRDFSSGFLPDRDYRNLDLSSTTFLKSGWGTTSALLAWGDRPFGAAQFYGNYPSWERTRTWYGSIQQTFDARTQAAFGVRRHTDLFDLFRDAPQIYENRHEDKSWEAAVRRTEPIARNAKIFWGVEGDQESIRSTALGDHSRARGAFYASFDERALQRFSFSVGAREEIYSAHGAEFSPSAAAGYWISRRFKVRAAASRAFRLPDYTDLYYRDPSNAGNPNLRPETAWTYEGGLDWTNGGRIRAAATLFQNRVRDGIDYVQYAANAIWMAENIQRLNLTGVEASVNVEVARNQRLTFSYTGIHGAQATLGGVNSRYLFSFPSQNGVATWEGALPRGIVARTRVGVLQRYAASSYALWDASAAYHRSRLHPYIQLSNITNTGYQQIQGVIMSGRTYLAGCEMVLPLPK
ncbi:MAG: TonB-dependent receptor [Bryobacteraceae bacterium]|jgi:iron complex outermembrane receptor protein